MRASLRSLLAERIDYAGLFPPAALPMADAVANFASYRESADAWALARFVLPVGRLEEFEGVAAPHLRGAPWRLAVLAQPSDAGAIGAFNARLAGRAHIDTVESRAATVDDVAALAPLATLATTYVELPIHDDPAPLVTAVAAHGLRAKVRTGGVTADSFPTAGEVARFLVACVRHRVMLKATAGLHHPLRGDYLLTYDAHSARATMFGYLNVFLAASFARQGMDAAVLAELLEERDAGAFHVDDDRVTWRGHTRATAALASDRDRFAISFGSCSFREPLDDLSALSLP
ncbi:MAG: hypothetical protein C0497_05135 [Gemmatimonas sp.]|nr:hypothetical protein [Gemmatimonas sp.]